MHVNKCTHTKSLSSVFPLSLSLTTTRESSAVHPPTSHRRKRAARNTHTHTHTHTRGVTGTRRSTTGSSHTHTHSWAARALSLTHASRRWSAWRRGGERERDCRLAMCGGVILNRVVSISLSLCVSLSTLSLPLLLRVCVCACGFVCEALVLTP